MAALIKATYLPMLCLVAAFFFCAILNTNFEFAFTFAVIAASGVIAVGLLFANPAPNLFIPQKLLPKVDKDLWVIRPSPYSRTISGALMVACTFIWIPFIETTLGGNLLPLSLLVFIPGMIPLTLFSWYGMLASCTRWELLPSAPIGQQTGADNPPPVMKLSSGPLFGFDGKITHVEKLSRVGFNFLEGIIIHGEGDISTKFLGLRIRTVPRKFHLLLTLSGYPDTYGLAVYTDWNRKMFSTKGARAAKAGF